MPRVYDNVLSGGRVPHTDSCANPARGQAQSFRRPGNGVDCGSHVDAFDDPGMTSVGKEGMSSTGLPYPYQPIASSQLRRTASFIGAPGAFSGGSSSLGVTAAVMPAGHIAASFRVR